LVLGTAEPDQGGQDRGETGHAEQGEGIDQLKSLGGQEAARGEGRNNGHCQNLDRAQDKDWNVRCLPDRRATAAPRPNTLARLMEWLKRNVPTVLLGIALLASAVLLLALMSGLTFFQDSWGLLLDRQDFSARAFFMPHNEHIVVAPTAIEKLLVETFGMTTALPEQIVMTLAVLASASLLFVYVRRRLGPWPALIAAVLFLFLGPAWADMIWPFQIGFVGSVLFGIAMLLALDRGDRRSDIAACGFLVLSLSFSSLGLPFLVAAGVDVLQRRRQFGLARVFVPAIPALLYAAWWLGWGQDAERHVTLKNVLTSPGYALEGNATAVEALLGLNKAGPDAAVPPEWGLPILVALVVLVAYGQVRKPGFSPRFWPVAAAAATSWFLAAANFIPGREAYQNRYIYAGAAFVLLLSSELLRDLRFSRRGLLVAGAVALAAVGSNLVTFREGGRWLQEQTVLTRADLGAIEIARGTVDSSFALTPDIAGTGSLAIVSAGRYLEVVRKHGSPAYTPGELARAPEAGRRQADIVLSQALPLSTETIVGAEPEGGGDCTVVPPSGTDVHLSPGVTRIEVPPESDADIKLARFAAEDYPVPIERLPGGSTTLLTIPADVVDLPWRLRVEAAHQVRVCR
jgi:hypothetical protein